MKKTIFFLFFALISVNLFAQFYYPNGQKVKIKAETPKALMDSLGIVETETYIHKNCHVYFKRLSNKPVFLYLDPKISPLKTKEIINSYNYTSYLNSYSYYWDLNDMIKEKTLTKSYLEDVFGSPDSIVEEEDSTKTLIYRKYNLSVNIEGTFAKSVRVFNANAMERNKLSILNYKVTGDDYSIGFNITFYNLAKKTIKYVFVTATASNAVHDKILTKTLKAIGPIEPSESGSYEFEGAIYSKVAQYLSLNSIKVQYMDGSLKVIPKAEIQYIRMRDWEEEGNTVID